MKTGSLTLFSLLSVLLMTLPTQGARVCTTRTTHLEFCQKMKHLGTSINALESQSALMRFDPNYLIGMALSVRETTEMLAPLLPQSIVTHKDAFFRLYEAANRLDQESRNLNPEMFTTVNKISRTCQSCHSVSHQNPGQGQIHWNQMFSNNWTKITSDCSTEGKNPYHCKSMNAIAVNFNHIVTASLAKIHNYTVTLTNTREILRILKDLRAKGFDHMGQAASQKAEQDTQVVIDLATQQNPLAFERARNLSQTCMQCHNQVASLGSRETAMAKVRFK
jgi:nitrate/TMAO reductase-like tetraheme cytochrome c subunit